MGREPSTDGDRPGVIAGAAELEQVRRASVDREAARQHLATITSERDAALAAAFAAGHPIAQIAAAAGISQQRVSTILHHPHRTVGRPRAHPNSS